MYASNTENGEVSSSDQNCQTTESEVKFLKEWLILHLDLIQQQNDEILDKEKTILILQKENEMLKERINCMEQGTPFQPTKLLNLTIKPDFNSDSFSEDMTQDSGLCDADNKSNIELLNIHCDNGDNCSLELLNFDETRISDSESPSENNVNNTSQAVVLKTEDFLINDISDNFKSDSEHTDLHNSLSEFNFQINSCSEFDPMRNLRMSIRRKRLCSNSSGTFFNTDSVTTKKRSYKAFKKKRRCNSKDAQIMTTCDHYVTQMGDLTPASTTDTDLAEDAVPDNTNLEVPRWRVKHYASCYSMEGTENLDDEVYNKRHMRHENDERRRKRWDVQRIREQRVIEKLKQRQERVGSGSRSDERSEPIDSLWPKLEDIKYIEVTDELPVSAFGCPIPKITSRYLPMGVKTKMSFFPNFVNNVQKM